MYIVVTIGCLFVLAALAAWKIVPLLLARPTIAVDYLSQANEARKPPNYDPKLNAAPYYERLFSEFVPLPELLDSGSWPGDLSPDEYKALEEWVPANQAVLSALADAARCPYWWSEMKAEDGALSSVRLSHKVEIRICT